MLLYSADFMNRRFGSYNWSYLCFRWLFGGRLSSYSAVYSTVWPPSLHHRSSWRTNTTTPFVSRGPLEPAFNSCSMNMWVLKMHLCPPYSLARFSLTANLNSHCVLLKQKGQQLGNKHFEDRSLQLKGLPLLSTDFYSWLKLTVGICMTTLFVISQKIFWKISENLLTWSKSLFLQNAKRGISPF